MSSACARFVLAIAPTIVQDEILVKYSLVHMVPDFDGTSMWQDVCKNFGGIYMYS